MSQIQEVIDQLKRDAEPEYRKKMEYFNVPAGKALGVRTPQVRKLAKEIKTNQRMAIKLWDSQIHEARMLATMVADPKLFTVEMMEKWLKDVYSWDLCDGACFNLIHKHEDAWQLPYKWIKTDHEFTKRAGFALIAKLTLGNKPVDDDVYINFLKAIEKNSEDTSPLIKKAVSWAVRQIGKRNINLNQHALCIAQTLETSQNKGARWAAKDILRELRSDKVQKRIRKKTPAKIKTNNC